MSTQMYNAAPAVQVQPQPLGGKAAGIIVQGVTQKKLPTNSQVTASLDSMRATIAQQRQTGKYGARIAADVQAILQASKTLLEEKNSNDLLQRLSLHLREAALEAQGLKERRNTITTVGATTTTTVAANGGLAPPLPVVGVNNNGSVVVGMPTSTGINSTATAAAATTVSYNNSNTVVVNGVAPAPSAQDKGKLGKAIRNKVKKMKNKKSTNVSSGKMEDVASSSSSGRSSEVQELIDAVKNLTMSMANSSELRQMLINLVSLARDTAKLTGQRVKKYQPMEALKPLQHTASKQMNQVMQQDPAKQTVVSSTPVVVAETIITPEGETTIIAAGNITQSIDEQPILSSGASSSAAAGDNIGQAKQIGGEMKSAALETKTRMMSMGRDMKREILETYKSGDLPVDQAKLNEIKAQFGRLFDELMAKPDLARSLKALMDLTASRWPSVDVAGKTQRANNYFQSTSVASPMQSQTEMTIADKIWMDVRLLISQWTGAAELDTVLASWTQVITELSQDKEASLLAQDFRQFLNEIAADPQLMRTEKFQNKPMEFFDRFVVVMRNLKNHQQLNLALKNTKAVLLRIKNDQATTALRNAWSRFATDMITDEDGRIDFLVTKESLGALQSLLLPILSDQFNMIPLPPITQTSDAMDVSVSNITIAGIKLLPEHFNIRATENVNFNLKSSHHMNNNVYAKLRLQIRNFAVELHNVHFAFARKQGFPKLREEGDVDLFLGGPLSKLTVKLNVYMDKNRVHFVTDDVKVRLDKLRVRFAHLRRHSVLLPMAMSMFNGTIKKQIEKQIRTQMHTKLEQVCLQLDNAAANARARLRTLPARFDAQLRRASDQANVRRLQARQQMKRARKNAQLLRQRATDTVTKAYTPFLENQGMPLAERAQLAQTNLRGGKPQKQKKSRRNNKASLRNNAAASNITTSANLTPVAVISTPASAPAMSQQQPSMLSGMGPVLSSESTITNAEKRAELNIASDLPKPAAGMQESAPQNFLPMVNTAADLQKPAAAGMQDSAPQNFLPMVNTAADLQKPTEFAQTAGSTTVVPDNFVPLKNSEHIAAGNVVGKLQEGNRLTASGNFVSAQ